jgi:HrpA-like RNA helicase
MIGSKVGYHVGLRKEINRSNFITHILFCTTGIILKKVIHDAGFEHYTHIILDEIHERSIDTDLLMAIIRNHMIEGTCKAKIILMSATIDAGSFVQYFTLTYDNLAYIRTEERESDYFKKNLRDKIYCEPKVIAMTPKENDYKVDIRYLDDFASIEPVVFSLEEPKIEKELYLLVADIILSYIERCQKSVLVFLPGIFEIESLHTFIANCSQLKDKCVINVLHSSLPADNQQEVFQPNEMPKVILSTNIAESSVTIRKCVLAII